MTQVAQVLEAIAGKQSSKDDLVCRVKAALAAIEGPERMTLDELRCLAPIVEGAAERVSAPTGNVIPFAAVKVSVR